MKIDGVPVYRSNFLTIEKLIRGCRSRKKRVVKKWGRNKRNHLVIPDPKLLVINNYQNMFGVSGPCIIGHPATVARLERELHDGREHNDLAWGE